MVAAKLYHSQLADKHFGTANLLVCTLFHLFEDVSKFFAEIAAVVLVHYYFAR